MTATAAQIFEQARVHVAIFEVGLGGGLDARMSYQTTPSWCRPSQVSTWTIKNSWPAPQPPSRGREKAGIARPAKPCILGVQAHPEVQPVVQDVVHAIGGQFIKAIEFASLSVSSLERL